MGIRLRCPNGHPIHVKSFLAGKRGVCPQCGEKFDIPADTGESDDGGGDEISVVSSATAEAPRSPTATKKPVGGNLFDLESMAAAGGTSLLGGQAFGAAGQRLHARRKQAQTMRRFTLALTVAVTLLACILLYIVFRSH